MGRRQQPLPPGRGQGKRPSGLDQSDHGETRPQALNAAEREHDEKVTAIQVERKAIEEKSRMKDARWDKEEGKLRTTSKRARE